MNVVKLRSNKNVDYVVGGIIVQILFWTIIRHAWHDIWHGEDRIEDMLSSALVLGMLHSSSRAIGGHECSSCGKMYKMRSSLYRHMRYECGSAKKQQQCNICGKKYTRPEYVREHYLKRHTNVTY